MTDRLPPNGALISHSTLTSGNGKVVLEMQDDGNLVLYRVAGHCALWSTGTWGKPVKRAVMQPDGNLVLYDLDSQGHFTQSYWASNTAGHPGSSLVLQDDGNLVIYDPANTPVFNTNTGGHHWNQQRVDLILKHLICKRTTEDSHDEIYLLLGGEDGAGKRDGSRLPDGTKGQFADADWKTPPGGFTAWDMNDSGSLQSRELNVNLWGVPLALGQTGSFNLTMLESDSWDYASGVKAAGQIAEIVGKGTAAETVGKVVQILAGFMPHNEDDILGHIGVTVKNIDGEISVTDVALSETVKWSEPFNPCSSTFEVRLQHDRGDYVATFVISGA